MIQLSFSVRKKTYRLQVERAHQVLTELDKFLKSHKIKRDTLTAFQLRLLGKTSLLERFLVRAIVQAKAVADSFSSERRKS